MTTAPGPERRIARTALLRGVILLALIGAGLAAYAAWVAPLWVGGWWWVLRVGSLFVIPTLAAAYGASWLIRPRGTIWAPVALTLIAALAIPLAPLGQRLAHRAYVEFRRDTIEWLASDQPPDGANFRCGTWVMAQGFDRVVNRPDGAALAHTFGDRAQGLLYLPEGTPPPERPLDEYRLRSIEPIADGWHFFEADF